MTRLTDINTGNDLLDQSLENYLIHGFEPGGFLTSVLANDLYLAVGRADHWNKDNLPRIVNEIQYNVPVDAYGSYAAVKEWCFDADGRRSYYSKHVREKKIIEKLQSVT